MIDYKGGQCAAFITKLGDIMEVVTITEDNFAEYATGEKPLLLDLYADWCGPCRMMAPVIEKFAEDNDNLVVGKLDVDSAQDLSNKLGVRSIPTLVLFNNSEDGDVLHVGTINLTDLKDKVSEALNG